MSEEKKELKKVEGLRTDLDGDRSVFLGKCDNVFYLRFLNKGMETKIKLSTDAMAAVVALGLEHFGISA